MEEFIRNHIQRYSSLKEEELRYVAGHFRQRRVKKGDCLLRVGEEAEYDYLVMRGCLKASWTGQDGKVHILQFATPDWWITDYQAYYQGGKARVEVDCLEEGEVLALSRVDREKLCAELHSVEHFFRKKANQGYVGLQQRILSLLSSTPRERYETLLAQQPVLFQKVPKQLLAGYLGVSRETLSRLYKDRKA